MAFLFVGTEAMEIEVGIELRQLCEEIVAEGKTVADWAEVESDDMFQSASFSGGFDADEMAFCFSHYDSERRESWFQLTLEEIGDVAAGRRNAISARPVDGV